MTQIATDLTDAIMDLPGTVSGNEMGRVTKSAAQALLAAKAGATYVSPFIGRLDDVNEDGLELIKSIRMIYDNYNFETNILAASLRSKAHINKCAEIGADFATIPYTLLNQLFDHPLTTKGLEIFLADHAKLNP